MKRIKLLIALPVLAAFVYLSLLPALVSGSPVSGLHSMFIPVVKLEPAPTPTATPQPTSIPPQNWLGYVNSYREMADLPPVTENPEWSDGCWLHARYAVKNDKTGHTEDPALPWYTPEGLACAQSANLTYTTNYFREDQAALDGLMTAVFHGVGFIDPALQMTGFGSYREANGGLQHVVAVDVIRGLGSVPSSITFPVLWPGRDATTPLPRFDGNEHPNPLASCPGYTGPTGAPIILQIGPGNRTPDVTHASVTYAGTVVHGCVFDETTYVNPVPEDQQLGRAILDARDAIVFLPRNPLVPGARYYVSIVTNGEAYSWSFTVSEQPRTSRPAKETDRDLIESSGYLGKRSKLID